MIYKKMNKAFFKKETLERKMNKKGDTISIVVLTALTLILVTLSIYYFVISERERTNIFNVPAGIDSIYTREAYLNFYLGIAFERASKDFKYTEGKRGFIEKFKNELEDNDDNEELEWVKNSISESNVELTKTSLKLIIPIVIEGNFQGQGFEVKHSYEKVFEKTL